MTDAKLTLETCPFCGQPPIHFGSGEGGRGLMIECQTPGCVNPHVSYYDHASAINAWNRRSGLARQEPVASHSTMLLVEEYCNARFAAREHHPSPSALKEDRERINRAHKALLTALSSSPLPDTRVKALEWLDWPKADGSCRAVTPWGTYNIDRLGDGDWYLRNETSGLGSRFSLDEAKAAAQADYEQRIRSALVPSPIGGEDILAPFAANKSLELSWGPIDDEEGSPCMWRVHEQWGNVNDREWRLRATGKTPAEAIRALTSEPAK